MTTPNALKDEFTVLFEEQRVIENDPAFLAKKAKYADKKLETKYDQTQLSEIFQDPDLLARISNETFSFIKLKERGSRVRNHMDLVTTKKPQAKDVPANRVIADEELERIKAAETNINNQNEYINPIASKKRRYLAHNDNDPIHELLTYSQEEGSRSSSAAVSAVEEVPATQDSNSIAAAATETADTPTTSTMIPSLALPAATTVHSATTTTANSPSASQQDENNDEHPLERSFRETAQFFKQSPLKTVGSEYLYTLLPRQSDVNAYKYVKEDYTPQSNTTTATTTNNTDAEQRHESSSLDDTLLTITLFNPAKTNKKFQEIEILGSQSLSDYRDAIYCLSDFTLNGDRQDKEADGAIINTSDKKLSPSFIYMDHIFYIDTRLDAAQEYYHDWIENWLTKKGVNRRVFKFQVKIMQECLFENTPIKLHQPFVFMHQEKCEHMAQIQDIRLLSPSEYKSKLEFPRTTHNLRYDRFKCSMCTIFPATKITEEEVNSGFSPCYYCDNCFESFHAADTSVVAKEYSGTPGGDIKLRSHKY